MDISAGIYKLALASAEKSSYFPFRLGAVLFKGKRILSSGYNQVRSHRLLTSKYYTFTNSLHAEMNTIFQAGLDNCQGCSIFVIRLNLSDCIRYARPCDECMQLIKHVGIKNIYYSGRNGEICFERV